MILKYIKTRYIVNFLILSFLKSLQVVFIALISQQMINWITDPKLDYLLMLVVIAFAGLILFWVIGILYQKMYFIVVKTANYRIKAIASNYLIFNNHPTVNVDTSFFTNDLKALEANKVEAELQIVTNVIQFITAVVSASVASIPLTIIFMLASFLPGILQRLLGKNIEAKSQIWDKDNSKYTETVKETEMFSKSARLYNSEAGLWRRFKSAASLMENSLMRLNFWEGFTNETISVIAYAAITIAPIALGVYLVSIRNITLGTLIMISQLSNNFVNPVITISAYVNNLRAAKPMWNKFLILTKNTDRLESRTTTINDPRSLTLKDVTVALDGNDIFENVSFNVEKGDKVLIVAPSGWGKSTLLNTLLGNVAIKNGEYLINNQSVTQNVENVHNYFSYINQEPRLLDDTVLYNITLGNPVSDNQLNDVIKKSGLSDLVKNKGLDFKVGKSGENLSGGQKQRIEIARALYFKRPFLLADEATASLDPDLSKKIHDTLLKDYSGTVIEVAHHLSDEERNMFNKVYSFK